MWLCHTCGELGRGGYQAVVTALEDHLRTQGHRSGTYSYGGPGADRETVMISLARDKVVHQRQSKATECEDAA